MLRATNNMKCAERLTYKLTRVVMAMAVARAMVVAMESKHEKIKEKPCMHTAFQGKIS